jgi:UDP-N-acetylglucosamine acyltransferase
VVIHQFSRIGRLAMIGGNTRVNADVPPYFLYSEFDVAPKSVNIVGLRRAGFTASEVSAVKAAYRLLYRSGLRLEQALERITAECDTEHTRHIVRFIRSSERGIARPSRRATAE